MLHATLALVAAAATAARTDPTEILSIHTFGYDLATPAATPRHEGYWFSVGLGAQDRLPPADLVPAWPSMRPAPPARTAYRVNCVACAEPHCLQKTRRARRRPG